MPSATSLPVLNASLPSTLTTWPNNASLVPSIASSARTLSNATSAIQATIYFPTWTTSTLASPSVSSNATAKDLFWICKAHFVCPVLPTVRFATLKRAISRSIKTASTSPSASIPFPSSTISASLTTPLGSSSLLPPLSKASRAISKILLSPSNYLMQPTQSTTTSGAAFQLILIQSHTTSFNNKPTAQALWVQQPTQKQLNKS